jgi:hypothetical protein
MRFTSLGFVVLIGLGCNGLHRGPSKSCEVPTGSACAVPEGGACAPPCGPKPTCLPEKPKEERNAQPRDVTPVERTTSRASVTQDVLLIPRMVYVPYAPQVPVAPARLGMVAPAERVVTENLTTREATPAPRDITPAAQDRTAECLDKCSRMLEHLDNRLRALERPSAPCPVPEPILPKAPCPPPAPGPTLPPTPGTPASADQDQHSTSIALPPLLP